MNTLLTATWQVLLLRRSPGVSISIFKEDDQHNRGVISQSFHMITIKLEKITSGSALRPALGILRFAIPVV
jgi:hypothetical protein